MSVDRSVLIHECRDILKNNILSFWMKHSVNITNSSFFGEIDRNGKANPDAERGGILQSRILWAFSAGYNSLKDPEYLKIAEMAYDSLYADFWDKEFGGIYFSIDSNGKPLNTSKMTDCQCYAIYGINEFFTATRRRDVFDLACEIIGFLEGGLKDSANGGYVSSLNNDYSKDFSDHEFKIFVSIIDKRVDFDVFCREKKLFRIEFKNKYFSKTNQPPKPQRGSVFLAKVAM